MAIRTYWVEFTRMGKVDGVNVRARSAESAASFLSRRGLTVVAVKSSCASTATTLWVAS